MINFKESETPENEVEEEYDYTKEEPLEEDESFEYEEEEHDYCD
ncbi:MAG: hypothetical protein Q9M34_00015 [Sulfurimonas sp.]|nr:hypothetical protein [Sulfurimonas sp.]